MKKKKSSYPGDDETAHPHLNTNTSNQNTPRGGGGRKQTPLEKFADSILNFNDNNDNKTKKEVK